MNWADGDPWGVAVGQGMPAKGGTVWNGVCQAHSLSPSSALTAAPPHCVPHPRSNPCERGGAGAPCPALCHHQSCCADASPGTCRRPLLLPPSTQVPKACGS